MLPSWRSIRTVSKYGIGFQIPGVFAFIGTALQNMAPLPQSGWVPLKT